jgi:hypothetical protein
VVLASRLPTLTLWWHTEGAQQACHRLLGVTQEDMEARSHKWHLSKAMCLISTGVLLYPATILWTVHSTNRMPSWYAASRSSAHSNICVRVRWCVCPLVCVPFGDYSFAH